VNITKEIYDELSQDSRRFLKYNSKLKGWQELSSSQVRDKVGHSLRFRNKQRHNAAVSDSSTNVPSSQSKTAIRRLRNISMTDSESELLQLHTHSRNNSSSTTTTVSSATSPSESPVPSSPVSQRKVLSLSMTGWKPPQANTSSIHRVSPPAPSKTMHILNAAYANFGSQIPLTNPEAPAPTFSDSALASTTTAPDISAMSPALVLSNWDNNDTTYGSSRGPMTLANNDRDVIDIMQEPLMEFEPQSFPLLGNSEDLFLG